MAYAMLASVEPIVGLYTSFFPVMVYIMMGTSPHSSFGELFSRKTRFAAPYRVVTDMRGI